MRFYAVILLFSLAGLLPAKNVSAQDIPPPVVLNVPHVQQDGDVWCWLAVSEMIVQHYHGGISLPQCMMLDIVAGTPAGTCCRNPDDCRMLAHGLEEVQLLITEFAGQPSTTLPVMPPLVLYGALQSGHPVIAHIFGHVVVIQGMRFEYVTTTTDVGTSTRLTPFVLYNDPERPAPVWLPYEIFRSGLVWIRSLVIGN